WRSGGRDRTRRAGQLCTDTESGTLFPYTTRNALSGYEMEAPMAATTTSLSLGAFYAADLRRDLPRGHDLGLWWLGDDWHAPRFRAAWVAQTGELYLMQHEGTPGGGRLDGVPPPPALNEIENRVEGWRDVVGEWGSVPCLRDRLGLPAVEEPP